MIIDPAKQTPITVLTGFLGAGKSTLLKRLLTLQEFGAAGVVINEFGDVPIDHDVLAEGLPEMAVTSTGCICCTIGGDIRAAVSEMHEAAQKLGRLPLPQVIVETTGMADPAPVVNQLVAGAVPAYGLRDHIVARNYRLAGVVTAFDVVSGPQTLPKHPESVKQIAFADIVILTKADLIEEDGRAEAIATAKTLVRQINPGATILTADEALRDMASVFAPRPYAPRDLGPDVEEWLTAYAGAHHHHAHDHSHGGHHHHDHGGHHHKDHGGHHHQDHGGHQHHDHGAHSREGSFGVGTFSLVLDEPLDKQALIHAMDMVQMLYGTHLLRLKGVLHFADDSEAPHILQVVQHVVHPLSRQNAWPSEDRRSRIVAITFGMDPDIVSVALESALRPAVLKVAS
ncbi:MAG: GTP-binding protein [Pseudomonadota bacterium]